MDKIGIIDAGVDTPEEIIMAADLIPYRLFGDPTISHGKADEHVPPTHCVWSRNLLEQGINGFDESIKGIISTHGCDCTNRQFDIWLDCVAIEFMYFLNSPLKRDKIAMKFYIEDLQELISQLENHFNVQVTEEKLREAIILNNKIRTNLRKISEYRSKMVLKGSEFLEIIKLVQTTNKIDALEITEKKLEELKTKPKIQGENLNRILITGSIIDDVEFIRNLENSGYQIVIDDLCTGTHYFWIKMNEEQDPLESIIKYHFEKPIYSTKIPSHKRFNFIESLLEKYEVDGVINIAQKFCESVLYDHPYYKRQFREMGVPYLFVEKEYNREAYKQLSTRFEAFAEII